MFYRYATSRQSRTLWLCSICAVCSCKFPLTKRPSTNYVSSEGWRVFSKLKGTSINDVRYFWPFSKLYSPIFIKFWYFFHCLQIFSSLMGFCNITLHIFFMPYGHLSPYFYSFWQIFQSYVYSLPYVYSGL